MIDLDKKEKPYHVES
ncbi:Protein of unknown function [Bacillus thuringiensis]|uniref:Uncharacterized protein n=1 Tax=Bacillus thuringiensis TaxID=1428 RepID=A0A1C4BDE1_BACTU|nr:Protein of unknown function [Bacillus thuringiensis]